MSTQRWKPRTYIRPQAPKTRRMSYKQAPRPKYATQWRQSKLSWAKPLKSYSRRSKYTPRARVVYRTKWRAKRGPPYVAQWLKKRDMNNKELRSIISSMWPTQSTAIESIAETPEEDMGRGIKRART